MAQRFPELFSALHRSLLDVLRAELETLAGDLSSSGRRLGSALSLLAIAAVVAVVFVGVLVLAAILALALVLPLWASALVIAGVLALTMAILGAVGLRRLRTVENPAETVRRRVNDHLSWWQTRLAAERELPEDVQD